MECPKCDSLMEQVQASGITVDRCSNCRGIWFDEFEKDELKNMKGADSIDIGDPKLGRKYGKIEDIDCPICHTKMTKMVDVEQSHIWFESCTICGGLFFDAGEFKDLSKKNFLDFIKDLLTRTRK